MVEQLLESHAQRHLVACAPIADQLIDVVLVLLDELDGHDVQVILANVFS
jgi:hypothetical protein